ITSRILKRAANDCVPGLLFLPNTLIPQCSSPGDKLIAPPPRLSLSQRTHRTTPITGLRQAGKSVSVLSAYRPVPRDHCRLTRSPPNPFEGGNTCLSFVFFDPHEAHLFPATFLTLFRPACI